MSNRERWSIIDDNECDYEVSNRGRIRNVSTKEIEQTYISKKGHLMVIFCKHNITEILTKRLTKRAFISRITGN